MDRYLIRDVSDTAMLVAACRAIETERSDALFTDPLAGRLAGERGRKIAGSMPHRAVTLWTVAIRTVVVDRFVSSAITAGVESVLNLGAGLDTRPYRMALPSSLRWIEVDQRNILDLKDELLRAETPKCRVERIALDLAVRQDRRELVDAIGSTSSGTIVITEGFVPYLSRDTVARLAADLSEQPTFRLWVTEYFSPAVIRWRTASIWGVLDRLQRKSRSMRNASFRFDPGDWHRFFADEGWHLKEMKYLGEESVRLHRPVPMPWFVKPLHPFMPRARRQQMLRMTGYALLERALDPEPAGSRPRPRPRPRPTEHSGNAGWVMEPFVRSPSPGRSAQGSRWPPGCPPLRSWHRARRPKLAGLLGSGEARRCLGA